MKDKKYFNDNYEGAYDAVYHRLSIAALFPPTTAETIALGMLTELEGHVNLTDKEFLLPQVDKYIEAVMNFKQ